MKPNVQAVYLAVRSHHENLYREVLNLKKECESFSVADQADAAYALREAAELLDDSRKELNRLRKFIEQVACLRMYQAEVTKIKTNHVSASVKVSMYANYPHKKEKDPKRFEALMLSMGIPQNVVDTEAVRVNWEGFKDWFTIRQSNGEPLPEGVDVQEMYSEYGLNLRKLKGVEE